MLEVISVSTFAVFIAIFIYKRKIICKTVSSYRWVFKSKSGDAFDIQISLNFICIHKIHSLCLFSDLMISAFQIIFWCSYSVTGEVPTSSSILEVKLSRKTSALRPLTGVFAVSKKGIKVLFHFNMSGRKGFVFQFCLLYFLNEVKGVYFRKAHSSIFQCLNWLYPRQSQPFSYPSIH